MKFKLILLITVGILLGCSNSVKLIHDTEILIFDNVNLYFDGNLVAKKGTPVEGIYRYDAGRFLVKKVKLPKYALQPKVEVEMTLTSNGDPWDKSGSLIVIPSSADLSVLDFEKGTFDSIQLQDKFQGIKTEKFNKGVYMPGVELLRFMTPFGIGHFNIDEKIKDRKPVYIPKWEDRVIWKQDITQLLPLLEGEVYIGVFIDTWTKDGYNLSVNLKFEESKIANHIKKEQKVVPLVNTTKYASNQGYYDEFSKGNLDVEINTETTFKNAKLYYITTGHGGHSEGDEFTQKENQISHNGKLIKAFIPWRDDCASFRRFNPHSGVWTQETTWKGETIKERVASSDFSRSNWCPGSDVTPEIIELGDLQSGRHSFQFSIPQAQAIDGTKINYWMVSAYIVYDE